ncbi:MAG: hypothetical protein ACE5ID_09800, partial [Acidobacteriota bacterium]
VELLGPLGPGEEGETTVPAPVHIGDSVRFLLRVQLENGIHLGDVRLVDDPEEFALQHVGRPTSSAAPGGGQLVEIPLDVIALGVGDLEFPGVEIQWSDSQGRPAQAASGPVSVHVEDLVKDPEQAEPADIRAPAPIQFRGMSSWFSWLLAILLVAIGLLIWLRWRRDRPQDRSAPPSDPFGGRTPGQWAVDALTRMEETDLLSREGPTAFHVRLSEIVRRYLAGQFGVEALERTTEEILAEVEARVHPLPGPRRRLQEVLRGCDLVKFARLQPMSGEARKLLAAARRFVLETQPEERAESA